MSLSSLPRVRVSYRKQVSDGNYGTEAVEVSFEHDVDTHDDLASYAQVLVEQARHRVLETLAGSSSSAVRHAVGTHFLTPAQAQAQDDVEDEFDEVPE